MKQVCRFLPLFFLLSLLFVTVASSINTTNESTVASSVSSISGASRVVEDLEGESFNVQNRLTPAIVGTTFQQGSAPSALRIDSLKFGNFRSVISVDGANTYGEWRFHQADETTINGLEDAYIALGNRAYVISDYSYQVLEFDLTTMTTFPSNLWIFSEWRGSDGSGKERVKFGSYNDSDGLWHFGDKTLAIEKNEWVHITLVFAIRREGSDYTSTVARIFVNDEFYHEIKPYPNAKLDAGISLKQHYIGIGWPYGKGAIRPGMDENASVCVDNVALTTFDRSSYSGNLEKVFASDFNNLSAFTGKEIVYKNGYTFPSSALAVATVSDKNKNVTSFATLQDAIDYVEDNKLASATIQMLADQYHPVEIAYPLTLDKNGKTLHGGTPTLPTDIILSSTSGDVLTFQSKSSVPDETVLTLIQSDGTTQHYTDTSVLSKIPSGATVILHADIPCPTSIYGTNYKFDFNGHTVYAVDGAKQEIFRGMGTVCIYSSKEGARVFTGTTMKTGTDSQGNPIYTNQAALVFSDAGATQGSKFLFGYKNTTEATPYPIDIFCGAFGQLGSIQETSVYLKNINLICAAGDNKGIFTTRNERSGRYWQIDDCNLLITNNKSLCANVNVKSHVGTYVFNNTNIFGNGSLFSREGAMTKDCQVTFHRTNTFGSFFLNTGIAYTDASTGASTNYLLTVSSDCFLTDIAKSGITLPDGYMFIPKNTVRSSGKFFYPDDARFVNFEDGKHSYLGAYYCANGYVGKVEEFSSSLWQSVAIDTSVSVLIYLPVSASVEGVFLDGENLLRVHDTKIVNGDDYYVVRVKVPPKEAYKPRTVAVKIQSCDTQLTVDASLLAYADKLFRIQDSETSGNYYADSQAMMKYVLYYIRTAANTIGKVPLSDLAPIDAYLGDFALTDKDKTIEETIYKTTSVSGKLTRATLNLDTRVGMVFEIVAGFVGTIRVDMPNVKSVIVTYTGSAPASSGSYVLLSDIPAYALREDVTVTVTTASQTSTLTFNLATYVNGTKTEIAYATYAYAKAAGTYRATYPNASAYGD